MPVTGDRLKTCGRALRAPALWLALFASGCSGMGAHSAATPDAGTTGSVAMSNSFAATPKVAQAATTLPPDMNCPAAEVRRGAATLAVGPTGQTTAMTLKYQGSFVRLARECSMVEGNMVAKVGIEGRIVLGPAGSPGRVGVPLRLAVVQETPSGMRPIATKFVMVPVDVGATGNTPFVYVEEALTFPIPTPTSVLDEYVIYVGFDPVSAEAQSKPPPKVRAKEKAKTKAKPAAGGN